MIDLLGLVGKVDFTVRHLSSSTTAFPSTWTFNSNEQCIGNGVHQVFFCTIFFFLAKFVFFRGNIFSVAHTAFSPTLFLNQCAAYLASPSSEKTWTMRTTFPEYVVALATIVGSVLFAVSSIFIKFSFCFKIRAKYLA